MYSFDTFGPCSGYTSDVRGMTRDGLVREVDDVDALERRGPPADGVSAARDCSRCPAQRRLQLPRSPRPRGVFRAGLPRRRSRPPPPRYSTRSTSTRSRACPWVTAPTPASLCSSPAPCRCAPRTARQRTTASLTCVGGSEHRGGLHRLAGVARGAAAAARRGFLVFLHARPQLPRRQPSPTRAWAPGQARFLIKTLGPRGLRGARTLPSVASKRPSSSPSASRSKIAKRWFSLALSSSQKSSRARSKFVK